MKTHPLKWLDLVDNVNEYIKEHKLGENPDVWIEDITNCGPCSPAPTNTYVNEDTEALEASFATILDFTNNRIIIKHHF